MRRALLIILVLVIAVPAVGWVLLRTTANGFSARENPTALESFLAHTARSIAMTDAIRSVQNPVQHSEQVLADARAHWADHCATCHANDGSGDTEMGRNLYPRAPDMRKEGTQRMTDGELFFIIQNGIRMSGMPAWGTGTERDAQDSWKLVHFIRHLPSITPEEVEQMSKMNPKTPADLEEEKAEEEFLNGGSRPHEHEHHH